MIIICQLLILLFYADNMCRREDYSFYSSFHCKGYTADPLNCFRQVCVPTDITVRTIVHHQLAYFSGAVRSQPGLYLSLYICPPPQKFFNQHVELARVHWNWVVRHYSGRSFAWKSMEDGL